MDASTQDTERQKRARQSLLQLAKRIRAARERRGLTQEAFAAHCGISVSFASLLERGERTPSYETLLDMAEALDVPLSELFSERPLEPVEEPHLARLAEFARKARLTSAQVDRLIAVGHAVFGVASPHALPSISLEGPRSSCSLEGCSKPVLAKGLCASHYHRKRRGQL